MAIPSSGGWNSADWRAWFGRLMDSAEKRLKNLQKGKGDPAKHVHETRKMLKRLRTGTRLLKGFAPKKDLKKAKVSIRDAGRLLSGSRDGTVRLQTFDKLMEMSNKAPKGALLEARKLLETEAEAASGTAGKGVPEALALLETVGLMDQEWEDLGKNDVKKNLAGILARARDYFHEIHEDHDEEFHELRKRVKDLYYSLGALPGEATGARKRVLGDFHVFEETLGSLNDLAVLMEWFEERGLDRKKCPAFWKIADPAVKEFRRIVLEEGVVLDELEEKARYGKVFLTKEE